PCCPSTARRSAASGSSAPTPPSRCPSTATSSPATGRSRSATRAATSSTRTPSPTARSSTTTSRPWAAGSRQRSCASATSSSTSCPLTRTDDMTDAPDDIVLVDVADQVATVTLNRPEARNALDKALRKALYTTLRDLDARDDVAAIVLTGADPAFCAGIDLKELAAGGDLGDPAEAREGGGR